MGNEDEELAGLFAAWREDIDSVPVPAMLVVEATIVPHVLSRVLLSAHLRPRRRFRGQALAPTVFR